ncbi:MAG: hypothetical protein PSY14_16485 [bacterium]|nr:hypothetical protein [bacterium]
MSNQNEKAKTSSGCCCGPMQEAAVLESVKKACCDAPKKEAVATKEQKCCNKANGAK